MQTSDNLKEKILSAAGKKMLAIGVRSVSIEDICRELGISKKTFYVYFDSKDRLVEDFLLRYEQHIHQQVKQAMEGKSVIDLMLNFVSWQKRMKDLRQIPALVYDLRKYYPLQFADYLRLVRSDVCELMTRMLYQGKQEKVFRNNLDVERTAKIYAALHMVAIEKLLSSKDHPTLIPDTKYAADIFFRGLISREGAERLREKLGISDE